MPQFALDIPADGGAIDATLHTPDGAGPWPGVVMLTDIRGPRPAFFAMADRLAAAGYAVLLPNIYWRLGRAPVPDLEGDMADPATMRALMALKAAITVAVMRADARVLIDALAAQPAVRAGPCGVVGYCMSGQYAVYAAETGGRVTAAASYHGGELVRDDADSPHRIAAALPGTAFYFGHADKDDSIPQARLSEFDRTLAEARADFTSEIYAGSVHGFAVPGTPRHDEAGAARHWRTMLQLFARTLPR